MAISSVASFWLSVDARQVFGELRISNLLLWQIAYAEIPVTEMLWPDFGERDFFAALIDYQKRDRRYERV